MKDVDEIMSSSAECITAPTSYDPPPLQAPPPLQVSSTHLPAQRGNYLQYSLGSNQGPSSKCPAASCAGNNAIYVLYRCMPRVANGDRYGVSCAPPSTAQTVTATLQGCVSVPTATVTGNGHQKQGIGTLPRAYDKRTGCTKSGRSRKIMEGA